MDFKDVPSECAIHVGDKEVCSSPEMISKMKDFLKAVGEYTGNISLSPTRIVETVKEKTGCDNESCIYTASPFVKYIGPVASIEATRELFKPEGPQKTDDLLSNFNIDDVLAQLSKKHPDFLHIPFR